mgnify:CR=1 FL=1
MSSVPVPEGRYVLLNQLRALAALSVVYSHLVGNFLVYTGQSWRLDDAVHAVFLNPLGFHDNGGWLGVSLFFFISGFVVTFSGTKASRWGFISRRLVRVYMTLVIVVVVIAILSWWGVRIWTVTGPVTGLDVAANASLAVFALHSADLSSAPWLPAAWTLVTEVMFYFLVLAILPVLKNRPRLAPWAALALVAFVVMALTAVNAPGSLATHANMLSLMVMGQATYLFRSGRLPRLEWVGAMLAAPAVTYALSLIAPSAISGPYARNYWTVTGIGLILFLAAVFADGKWKGFRAFNFIARRSYSIYLVHVPVGYTVMLALWHAGWMPRETVLVGLVAVAIAAELAFQAAERPTKAVVRRLKR